MRLAFLFALSLSACMVGQDPAGDDVGTLAATWGPYDPMPGHPTVTERDSFVRDVGPYAQEAERLYGTPAPAIIAMTCNEGGFGWTKTAYNVNNIFGWKWTSYDAADGRDYWVLDDQPDWDPNNKYVVFANRRDAVLFVAKKLATSSRYQPITQRYQTDLQSGVDVRTAANRWIEGIAYAGYNPYEHYPTTTINFMNNYREPGPTFSPVFNLYQYTKPTATAWISLDAPAANSSVAGDVTLAASVGGASITSVKFYTRAKGATDWYALGEDATAPFTKLWPTDPWLANGAYEIKIEAWATTALRATGVTTVYVAN